MAIPDGTPMDEDRRAMRAAAGRLKQVVDGIDVYMDDSQVLWGIGMKNARHLSKRLEATAKECEAQLRMLRKIRESVR